MAEKPSVTVSEFEGIDKNTYSTKISKKLFDAQNAYPRIPGVISKRPGTDYLTSAEPSISKIIECFPFYRSGKERMLLAYCKMVSIADPTVAPTLSDNGGGGLFAVDDYDICYSWVGCGAETKKSPASTISLESADHSVGFVVPAYPVGARRVNIYQKVSGNFSFIGSTDLAAGSTYVILTPWQDLVRDLVPTTVTLSGDNTSGDLEQGTYFVYACPFFQKTGTTTPPVFIESIITLKPTDTRINVVIDSVLPYVGDVPIAVFVGTQRYIASFQGIAIKPNSISVTSYIESVPVNGNVSIHINADLTLSFLQSEAPIDVNHTGADSVCVFDSSNQFSRELFLCLNYSVTLGSVFLSSSSYARFSAILDRCFITNNEDPVMKTDGYLLRYIGQTCDGSTGLTDPTGLIINPVNAYNLPLICSKIFNYNNQLILGGGKLGDDYYYASLPGDPDVFTRDRLAVQVNAILCTTSKGDRIEGFGIATAPGGMEGPGTSLIIGKTNSIHFQSIIPLFPGMGSPKKIIFSEDGVITDKGIVATEFGTFVIGRKNVYLLDAGGNIVPIGNPISKIIERLSDDDKRNIHAVYHKFFYKIFFKSPIDGIFGGNYAGFVVDNAGGSFMAGAHLYVKIEAVDATTGTSVEITQEINHVVSDNGSEVCILSPDDSRFKYNVYLGSSAGVLKKHVAQMDYGDTLVISGASDIPGSGATPPATVNSAQYSQLWLDCRMTDGERRFNWWGIHRGAPSIDSKVLDGYGDLSQRIGVHPYEPRIIQYDKETVGKTHGLFSDMGQQIEMKLRTGDVSFGTVTNTKRIWDVFIKSVAEKTSDILFKLIRNKDGQISNNSINLNVSTNADQWDEDTWLGDVILESGDLKTTKQRFGSSPILCDTVSMEITEKSDHDVLISDFGLHYELETRDI